MSINISNVKIVEIEESRPISSPRSDNSSILSQESIHSQQTLQTHYLFRPLTSLHNDNGDNDNDEHHNGIRRSQSLKQREISNMLLKNLCLNDSVNSQLTNPVDMQENNTNAFQIKDIMLTCPPLKDNNTKTFNTNWLYFQQSVQNDKVNYIQVPKKSNVKANNIDPMSKGGCNMNNITTANSNANTNTDINANANRNIINHDKNNSTFSSDTQYRRAENFSVLQESNLTNLPKKREVEISIDLTQELVKIKFACIVKLFNSNNLFHLIKFFNGDDLAHLLNATKQLRNFIQYSIKTVYLQQMIKEIKKSNAFFEILSAKLHYTLLRRKSIKIDYVTTIRFKSIFSNQIPYQNRATNLGVSFIYKSFNSKTPRFIDYYSLDLIPLDSNTPAIFMSREFTTFTLDHLQKTYIQPILPFRSDDQGILNIKVFTPENGFVNPSTMLFKYKLNYIDYEDKSNETNPRVCEYEDVCFHWKILSYLPQQNAVMDQLKGIFEPHFNIVRVQYEDIGYLIFKVTLKALKEGVIENKEELGITLCIKGKKEAVLNEIKKNDLLFERRSEFELRVDDVILFYLTNNNSKTI